MSYYTTCEGKFTCTPALTAAQADILQKFAEASHDPVEGSKFPDSPWCGWQPLYDCSGIVWTEDELSSYFFVEWLEYLISTYFIPWGIVISGEIGHLPRRFT